MQLQLLNIHYDTIVDWSLRFDWRSKHTFIEKLGTSPIGIKAPPIWRKWPLAIEFYKETDSSTNLFRGVCLEIQRTGGGTQVRLTIGMMELVFFFNCERPDPYSSEDIQQMEEEDPSSTYSQRTIFDWSI